MGEIVWEPTKFEDVRKKIDAEPERGIDLYIDGIPLIELYAHDYPQLVR